MNGPSYLQQELRDKLRALKVPPDTIERFCRCMQLVQQGHIDSVQAWRELSKTIDPDAPFEVHQLLFQSVYAGWDRDGDLRGPSPIWIPSRQEAADTNLARFMQSFQGDLTWVAHRTGDPTKDLQLLHQVSCSNPEGYWCAVLQQLGICFHTPPYRVLEEDVHQPDSSRWLPGAQLNIAHCALTSPLAPADATAIIWAQEGAPQQLNRLSMHELRRRAGHVAACARRMFAPGDAVAMNLPMTPEAVTIYLGLVLAGCAVVSIADSFAADEVRSRLRISGAKAIFTQDVVLRGGRRLPLYERVSAAGAPPAVVLPCQHGQQVQLELRPGDMPWAEFIQLARCPSGLQPCVADASSTTNFLFSSGTTGEPKAIPWTHITPLRCAADAWAHHDLRPGSRICWPTSLGWMMGPWLVYAALLNGATMALYQGAPVGRDFGMFVQAARVQVLGLVPSIVKAWRSSGCMAGLDWRSIRCFSSTGEASSPDDYHWLMSRVQGYRPVIEYCGGTEIGGAFLSSTLLQPACASTFGTPTMGSQLVLVGADGQQSAHGPGARPFIGELTLRPPLLGSSQRLLNRQHSDVYFKGMPRCAASGRLLRRHGDEVQRLGNGHYCALGRCDDTMNLGGIKVSSVELERVVLQGVPGAAEAAAVGVPSPGGGPEQLYLFIVPNSGSSSGSSSSSGGSGSGAAFEAGLKQQCQAAIRAQLNPLFKVEQVLLRASLPRTASNKVMRRLLRDEVLGGRRQAAAGVAKL